MCRSCVVCQSNLICSICNSAFLQLWSLPWDVCRCGSTVTTCDHGSSWSLHGNCSLFNMAHVVVQPCHTDLFTLVIHGCLDIAVTFDYTWQLQLSRHGNCSCPGMATAVCPAMATEAVQAWQLQLSDMFLSPNSLSTTSLSCTHLCTTLMAGTWLLPDATCCMKVLHFFRYNSWVFCHPCKFNFMSTTISSFFVCVTLICHIS